MQSADVKPPRGFIPVVAAPQRSVAASHGFFKVSMFVGREEEEEEMIPVLIQKPQDMLTIQRFVAIPGKAFRFHIELDRAPPEGVQYGCRVYVDKGGLDHRHVFNVAKALYEEQRINQDSNRFENVDESEPDHFFWFGPGETSYVVRGYYCSGDEAYEFKFGDLPKDNERHYDKNEEELERQKNEIGILRFQFSKVQHMVKRKYDFLCAVPSQAKDYDCGVLFKKGLHLSVKPGKRLKTERNTKDLAVLEREICYESRVYFNDLYGYKAMAYQKDRKFEGIYKEPSGLGALPLVEFNTTRERRIFYIDLFLTWLQDKRYARVENECNAEHKIEDPKTNEPIGTEDLVHFINTTLSPAASYIVCMGEIRPGNFGERLVQKRKVKNEERDNFFREKEEALVSFFANNPNIYELVENGRDIQSRVLYTVKKVEIEIIDSDDERSDDGRRDE